MRKTALILVTLLVIASLVLEGCSSTTPAATTQTSTEETSIIAIDGVINEWPSTTLMTSDLYGDISINVASTEGVDLKAVYALMDESYLYVAIQIYGVFAPSLLRNYFIALDFNNDLQDEYHFGVRPNGDTWIFDHTIDKNNWNPEKTSGVVVAGGKDTIEIKIPRKEHRIPPSILIYCRVTDGVTTLDSTKWFEVSQIGIESPTPPPSSIPVPAPAPEPAPSTEEIELKYDDGTAESLCSSGVMTGFSVKFNPPSTPFIINKIKVLTNLYGSGYENQTTLFEIRDKELAVLYSCQKPASEFTVEPNWIIVEIPDISTNDDFFVYFFTNSKREGGVYLHFDLSQANVNSEMVEQSGRIAVWPWEFPKDKTNWMIRVVGKPIK